MGRKKFYSFIGAIGLTVLISMLMIQERLIFFPEKLAPDYAFRFAQAQEINFDFEDKKVNSLLFLSETSPWLILYFHGNAGSLSTWGQVGVDIREKTQASVWVVDYPGYGKSEGRIYSEKQIFDFAEQFHRYAQSTYPGKKLVIYGRSIGSGAATHLATQEKLPLILESPFSSFSQLASELAPWFPSFLRRYSFENLKALKNFSGKFLLVHGSEDEVIPVIHSRTIANELPAATYVEIPSGRHNDLEAFPLYWESIREFLGTH